LALICGKSNLDVQFVAKSCICINASWIQWWYFFLKEIFMYCLRLKY